MHVCRGKAPALIGCVVVACTPLTAHAVVVSVTRIAYEGQVVPHNGTNVTLGYMNMPVTNALGTVAFTSSSASPTGDTVWRDSGVIWRNSDAHPTVLVGSSNSMGLSNSGEFIYSVLLNARQAVWTNHGKLLAAEDPHPILPGMFAATNSKPLLAPSGTAYWFNGYTAVSGSASQGYMFLKCTDTSDPSTITKIVQTGDIVSGETIAASPDQWRFDVSDDETQFMYYACVNAAPPNNHRLVVNGKVVAASGSPTGSGGNWMEQFQSLHIDNAGNYLFFANTTIGAVMLAYNGNVVLRRGMVIDGFELGFALRGAGMNNLGKFAFCWTSPISDVLFYGETDNPTAAKSILRPGDQIDYTGDGKPDAVLTNIHVQTTTTPGISLSDHDFMYVRVSLADVAGGPDYTAIIRIDLPEFGVCLGDITGDNTVNVADLLTVIGAWGPCGNPNSCPVDLNNDDQVNVADLLTVISAWGQCP